MKNCVGIADLLCAYADGEISEANKRLVEDHLAICENCSAILVIYREISSAVDDTNLPAPDSLRIGVMNRIQNESTPRVIDSRKLRNKHYQRLLTRFAPVAACLVVMLLVWQLWGETLFSPRDNYAMPASAPLATTADAPSEMPMPETDIPAPEMAAPAGTAADASTRIDDTMNMEEEIQEESIDMFGEPDKEEGSAEVPAAFNQLDHTWDTALFEDVTATESDRWYTNITGFEQADGAFSYGIQSSDAVIAITGVLPAILQTFEPHELIFEDEGWDDWPFLQNSGWELLYMIPSTDVPTLLTEIHNRNNTQIARNPKATPELTENEPFVIIVYSTDR